MTPTSALDEKAQAMAEQQAAADAELLAQLQARDADTEEPAMPDAPTEPTLAERFTAVAVLVSNVHAALKRRRTPLSEATLSKLFEVSLQYHAWDWQKRQQEAQNPFTQFMQGNGDTGEGSDLVGPEPDEILSAIEGAEAETDNTESETTDAS
jgi:hypothetical protein